MEMKIKKVAMIIAVIAVIISITALTITVTRDAQEKKEQAVRQQQQIVEEKLKQEKIEADKKLEEAKNKLKGLDIVLGMAKTINKRTDEIHLISDKIHSGELETTEDIKTEIATIDGKVRTMVGTYEQTPKTGIEATDGMVALLTDMTVSLDESLIRLNANIRQGNLDGFKNEMANVNDIEDNTNKIIDNLSKLKEQVGNIGA